MKEDHNDKDSKNNNKDNDDELTPMHRKGTPSEFVRARKDFMHWHESFASMLPLLFAKWTKIVDWLKSKRGKRLTDGQAKADVIEYSRANGRDEYIEKNLELFQKCLYSHVLNYTKDNARI